MGKWIASDYTSVRLTAQRASRIMLAIAGLCLLLALVIAQDRVVAQDRAAASSEPEQAASVTPADAMPADMVLPPACIACHGAGGAGGDRAPALVDSIRLRAMADSEIASIIKNGAAGGMPAFNLPPLELGSIVAWIRAHNQAAAGAVQPIERVRAGEQFFFGEGSCGGCHMARGRGGVNGPDLSTIAARSTVEQINQWLDDPDALTGTRKTASCPNWAFCPDLQWSIVNVELRDGTVLRGFSRNQAEHDLQLQTLDGKFHLLNGSDYVSITREKRSYMPAFSGTETERRDLLAYLTSLAELPLGPVEREDAVDDNPHGGAVPAMGSATASAKVPAAMEIAADAEWRSYDGTPDGNRYSTLDQINTGNVSKLEAKWLFTPGGSGLQTTPVVADGVMYVTGAQSICALDPGLGRTIWCAARNSGQSVRAGGLVEAARAPAAAVAAAPGSVDAGQRPNAGIANGTGPNRGVAVHGDLVYFVSDDAYLVALNRVTGGVVWTVPLTDPDFKGRYYNTAAPLIVGDMIVAGVAGGDTPLRGFLVAFDATTGALKWRLWTIPLPGDPLAETWQGRALPTGGGATWATGSYDPEANILYWAVGNPYPATDGSERGGSNLYTNSVLAIEPATGEVKWHFQFTPHDLHDWDSNEPLVLADTNFHGRPRKLLMQANRSGMFYVLDRITGEFLLGTPFVEKLSWASGIDSNGTPILLPGNEPTEEGTLTCPSVRGATNWYSTAFNPSTQLFYVMAVEDCGYYRKTGSIYAGKPNPVDPGRRYVRALNIEDGSKVWEKPLVGSHEANYTGVLSTAGNLVFHGETGGAFAALNAETGETLWTFRTNESWRATGMTYLWRGQQYIAVAAGGTIVAFALKD